MCLRSKQNDSLPPHNVDLVSFKYLTVLTPKIYLVRSTLSVMIAKVPFLHFDADE